MANPEHLAKLRKGVDVWNEWRRQNDEIPPKLERADLVYALIQGADLHNTDLSLANLSFANLRDVNLRSANLFGADLGLAQLRNADLSSADLIGADLSGAYLGSATLREVKLCDTDLNGANLSDADLSGADLSGADLSGINVSNTSFAGAVFMHTQIDDVDLSLAKGLDSVQHRGPSTVGIDTIIKSKGKIPEAFLRGCGVPEAFISYFPALLNTAEPIQFYSVFISYSSEDEAFAERLYADLQSKKVRCWYAPEDLKIGDKFRTRIDENIRVYDKLLLVLSERSVGSDWVEKEVETAMEKERQQKRTMLFPIRLDDSVMKVETGWPADVRRTRHIGDFCNWKTQDEYQKSFNRLMRDLKANSEAIF